MEHLEEEVTNLLMTKHEYTVEEAEEAIKDSHTADPEMWHDNADSAQLADYLASDDPEE